MADKDEIAGFLLDHPNLKGDMDWAVVHSLLSNGKDFYDGSTLFRYDIGKWRQAEGVRAVTEAIYRKAGLPVEAMAFERLFRFMAGLDGKGIGIWPGRLAAKPYRLINERILRRERNLR